MSDLRPPGEITLDAVVRHWAEQRPGATALSYADGREPDLDWRAFDQRIDRVAAELEHEIDAGAAVAVVCSEGVAFHVLLNGLWRLGAGVLLIDRHWGPAIVTDLVRLVGCTTVFAPTGWASLGDAPVRLRAFPLGDKDGRPRRPRPDSNTVALYATTSGTTDNPKCVAITHRRIRAAYEVCRQARDLGNTHRAACLFELNSLGILGVCFLLPREIGAETRVYPSFSMKTITSTWPALFQDEVDLVYLVPPIVRLLNSMSSAPETDRRLLAFCSAAPVLEHELRSLEHRFPLEVYNIYGLTELSFAVFFGARADDGGPSDTIGRALGIEARLVDPEGREVQGPGRGEMFIRGPMLSDGYLHNPAATGQSWVDGWLKTGDLAERDEADRYFIRGRLKDVVLRGGYTYYLGELEHYLRRAPGVVDACAFRGRDLPSGDELCVVAQVDGPVGASDLLQWIRGNMGPAKMPNALYVWRGRGLPRNSNGKILRPVLTDLHLKGELTSEELP